MNAAWLRRLALGLWLVAMPVEAQRTGGSFGSGDWESTSHDEPSTSSGESSGSWSSSSAGSPAVDEEDDDDHDVDHVSSSGEFHPAGLLVLLPLVLLILYVLWLVKIEPLIRRRREQRERRALPMDLVVYSVAVDGGHREAIQQTLEALARAAPPGSAAGRRRLLAGVLRELVELQAAWAYVGGALVGRRLAPQSARESFRAEVAKLRSRFRHETLRGTEGGLVERDAPADLVARPEEGEGLCVVSVVVAARGSLPEPRTTRSGTTKAFLLLQRTEPRALVAFEVVWSPSREEDRMSSFELETLYPELVPLDGRSVGRVFCNFCGAAYARELGRCPSCGAREAAP